MDAQIDWDKPWEAYDRYLPKKTVPQILMFLMEWGIGLMHDVEYHVGVLPNFNGYLLNVKAPTVPDALRGAMVKLFHSRENEHECYGIACSSVEKLEDFQKKFIEELNKF